MTEHPAESKRRPSKHRWIVPEVIQSSSMDCGPASLKALLEGFGRRVSYGRLREACQTDVDGTSIDSLEEVAQQLGLDAQQIMIPVDHLLVPSAAALPAIVVVRLADGNTHFVVAWRRHGRIGAKGIVQIMDPGTGRVWQTGRRFLDRCYVHEHEVPAAAWLEWASTEEFLVPLRERLQAVGVLGQDVKTIEAQALEAGVWQDLASLDAATRLVQALLDTGGLRKSEAPKVLPQLVIEAKSQGLEAIPKAYWSVVPLDRPVADEQTPAQVEPETVKLRGVVLVRVSGRKAEPEPSSKDAEPGGPQVSDGDASQAVASESVPGLSRELVAALEEESPSPWATLWRLVRAGGVALPAMMVFSSLVAAGAVLLESLILRAIFDLGPLLGSAPERWKAMAMWIGLGALLLMLRRPILQGVYRLGRHLEVRLRVQFLDKITRLPNQYFASRLVSDMTERSHSVHRLRQLPVVAERLCRDISQLAFTTLGIIWLDPGAWPWALAAAAVGLGVPMLTYPVMAERDLKARSHAGALSRFYLDGLLGLTAIRAHAAERSVRREHEALVKEWRSASEGLLRVSVIGQGLQTLTGFGLAAALLMDHLDRAGLGGGALLLVYWALRLPELGNQVFARPSFD